MRSKQRLLKSDAFIPRLHSLSAAQNAIAIANGGWNMCEFVAAGLALFGRSTESLKRFKKE